MARKPEPQDHKHDAAGAAPFAEIVEALGTAPGVAQSAKKGFAFGGLMVGGKLFAMPHGEELLLKLPAVRVAALIASGEGGPFDAGRGRPMKEWVTVKPSAAKRWLELAREAMAFVASSSESKPRKATRPR
jgi:hypothetical protein